VCEQIFKTLTEDPPADTKVIVTVSMLEIYNERLRDLLSHEECPPGGLKMKQSKTIGFFVEGLSKTVVDSRDRIMKLMDIGSNSRSIRATDMNATSSRAHTIFLISVEQTREVTMANGKRGQVKKSSTLNLVDLAGSERVKKTGSTGEGLKEGANINLSLLYLGQVISMIAAPKPGQVVPFRQSKLTSLLKEALGGNSKTALIAALSPAQDNVEETLSTCQFAARAKSVKTNAKVNLDEGSRMLNELKEENERLQAELAGMDGGGAGSMQKRIVQSFKQNKEQIKQMFNIIDADNSGEVSYEEFSEFLTESKSAKKLGDFAEVLSLMMLEEHPFQAIDKDGSGQISWEEFEAWVQEQETKEVDPAAEIGRLRGLINARQEAIGSIEMTPEKLAEISAEREKAVRHELEIASSKELERLKLEILTMRKQYRVKGDIRSAFEKNRDQVEKLFFSLDKDGSGEVSHEEFKEFLAHAEGLGEFGDMMRKLTLLENPFEELDIDGDGTLSWEEFLIWVQSQTAPRQKRGPSNEELQAQLKEKQKICKEARELAQQRKSISQGLETRVRELMKRVQSIQEKMQQANVDHKKKVAQWEEQAKKFMEENKRKMAGN